MKKTIKKKNRPRKPHIGIVVSEFNTFITRRLLDACVEDLRQAGVSQKNIHVVWVPGAFEIPLVARKLARKRNIGAVICLGCIIKGETLHYDLIAETTAHALMQISLETLKPIIFEILAADTVQLVEARSRVKGSNKGRDAAAAALDMIQILESKPFL